MFRNGNGNLALGILILAGLWCADFAECATFSVDTPAKFQAALATAQSNGEADTINVAAGVYNIRSTLTYLSTQDYALTISTVAAKISPQGKGDIEKHSGDS